MNILVDGRPLVASNAGITTFLRCALIAWAKQCPNEDFFVALPREIDKTVSTENMPSNIRFVIHTNALLRRLPNLVWLNVMMPRLARRLNADVYFSPLPCIPFGLPRGIKRLIVVHDVVNIEFRETMQRTNIISNFFFFNRSLKSADIIWTNSHYTADKVRHYFPELESKDIFIGCSVDRNAYKRLKMSEEEAHKIKEKHGIRGRFLLFVGSIEPRKNLKFLLSLMPEIYAKTGLQLAIVGARGWKSSDIKDIVLAEGYPADSTIFCGFVKSDELVSLYNTAECFVSTSLNEGFGMPQLEALCCGCPVVTAHNSAMVEVASGKSGARTVKGFEPKVWIDAIVDTVNAHPRTPIEELADYDWDNILKKLVERMKMTVG